MAWIAAIVQGVAGGIQMGVSMAELSNLPGAQAFSPTTDLETATSMSRRAAQQGMTPQERAAAEQAIGTTQSRTQRTMEQRGLGNLAAAVSQIRTTEAYNALEAQNQQIKRQNLGQYASLAGQVQSLQNQNVQSFNQMLTAQQTALGQSAKAGFQNLAGTGATIAEAIEGKEGIDKAIYTPEQLAEIEKMKQNRPMERTPSTGELGTNIATETASPDYQGMFDSDEAYLAMGDLETVTGLGGLDSTASVFGGIDTTDLFTPSGIDTLGGPYASMDAAFGTETYTFD